MQGAKEDVVFDICVEFFVERVGEKFNGCFERGSGAWLDPVGISDFEILDAGEFVVD